MRRKIEKIVPRYAWGPLILAVAVNMAVYEGVALFKDDLTFYSLELPIDRMLPFIAPFIVFYLLAFVQWMINYVLIAREGKTFCYRFETVLFALLRAASDNDGAPGSGGNKCVRLAGKIYLSHGCAGESVSVNPLSGKLVLYPCGI